MLHPPGQLILFVLLSCESLWVLFYPSLKMNIRPLCFVLFFSSLYYLTTRNYVLVHYLHLITTNLQSQLFSIELYLFNLTKTAIIERTKISFVQIFAVFSVLIVWIPLQYSLLAAVFLELLLIVSDPSSSHNSDCWNLTLSNSISGASFSMGPFLIFPAVLISFCLCLCWTACFFSLYL